MGKFGWSYPPGAANDPFAPYNQDESLDNEDFKEQFSDYESLGQLYKSVYKGTSCGAALSVTIMDPDSNVKDVHCDDLWSLGSFEDMDKAGLLIRALGVSSIVEGVDQCTDTYWLDWQPEMVEPEEMRQEFWDNLDKVEEEANDIWMQTHGCDTCAKHWGIDPDNWGDIPVWTDCPDCDGEGTVI